LFEMNFLNLIDLAGLRMPLRKTGN